MNREQAWQIVCEFIQNEGLRKHALAVEACMRAYARRYGGDEEKWAVTALLHDYDWEIHPQAPDHPMKGEPLLAERGVSDEIRRAILSLAAYSGVSRESRIEKALFACDELTGLLTAITYVKPSRSIHDVEVKSVKKKMKDKAFARGVTRDDLRAGPDERAPTSPGPPMAMVGSAAPAVAHKRLGFVWKKQFFSGTRRGTRGPSP